MHDHHHGHHHGHGPGHSHVHGRSLLVVLILTGLIMVVEAIGGILTNSLALLGDSAHMLTDMAALSLSLFAVWISRQPPSDKKTYGYHRTEILAAFVNGIFLVILALLIIWEAVQRFSDPKPIHAIEMLVIAVLGLLVNLFGAYILSKNSKDNLNIRGALFHVVGDALGSAGAIIAALCIHFWGLTQADPVISMVIALIIVVSAFRLILDTTHVILEGVPSHLEVSEILKALKKAPGVAEVHDLHVWSITSGMVALSVHIVAKPSKDCFHHDLLVQLKEIIKSEFEIDHVTIQIEDKSLQNSEPQI